MRGRSDVFPAKPSDHWNVLPLRTFGYKQDSGTTRRLGMPDDSQRERPLPATPTCSSALREMWLTFSVKSLCHTCLSKSNRSASTSARFGCIRAIQSVGMSVRVNDTVPRNMAKNSVHTWPRAAEQGRPAAPCTDNRDTRRQATSHFVSEMWSSKFTVDSLPTVIPAVFYPARGTLSLSSSHR